MPNVKCNYCDQEATQRLDLDSATVPVRGWVSFNCDEHKQRSDSEAVKYMGRTEGVTSANTKISRTYLSFESTVQNAILPDEINKIATEIAVNVNETPPIVWALNEPKELAKVAEIIFPFIKDRLIELLERNSPPCRKCMLEKEKRNE